MTINNFNLNKDLSNIIYSLSIKYPFYGLYLSTIQKQFTKEIRFAAMLIENINYKLCINPYFWITLNNYEKEGLLIHEIDHLILSHLDMFNQFNDKRIFNIASDLFINSVISLKQRDLSIALDDEFSEKNLPGYTEGTLEEYEDKYKDIVNKIKEDYDKGNISKEEYNKKIYEIPIRPIMLKDYKKITTQDIRSGTVNLYNKLYKIKEEQEKKNQQTANQNSNSGNKQQNSQTQNKNNSNPNTSTNSKNITPHINGDRTLIPHPSEHDSWEKINKEITPDHREIVKNQFKYILTNIVKDINNRKPGDLPGHLRSILNELIKKKPVVIDWAKELRKWLLGYSENFIVKRTKMKPNLYFPDQFRLKLKPNKHIIFIIDTSGSMKNKEIVRAFGELLEIKRITSCDVTVIEYDTKVYKEGVYKLINKKQVEDRFKNKVRGGGGTRLDNAIKYIKDNYLPSGVIYFTDGYVSKPKVKLFSPMIVILTKNGKTINMFKSTWKDYPCKVVKVLE